jgi:MHS family proline/betaine transporter-like MFS transporter
MSHASSALSTATAVKPSLTKTLFVTCIGNALEWFDIAVYGFFAAYIARAYFPTTDQTVSLLLAFGSFGVSFLIRPLGAIVLGAFADRAGRKSSLLASISLMMLGSLMIVVTPSYATLGLAAPLLILLARLIQGFSAVGFNKAVGFLDIAANVQTDRPYQQPKGERNAPSPVLDLRFREPL